MLLFIIFFICFLCCSLCIITKSNKMGNNFFGIVYQINPEAPEESSVKLCLSPIQELLVS